MRTGSAAASRGLSQGSGIWEVVGILAAVIPCGVFAGLYLATRDGLFLAMFALFAVAALVIVVARNPQRLAALRDRLDFSRAQDEAEAPPRDAPPRDPLAGVGSAAGTLRRTFTVRILKLLAFVAWILAWGVTASVYVDVVENANLTGLMVYVALGALGPIVLYVGLEASVKRLGGHMSGRDEP